MSTAIKEPRLWDRHACGRLVDRALGAGLLPPKPLNESWSGCFLTPSLDSKYTYPAALKDEIADAVGEYPLRHEGLPHRRQGVPPASGLRDDGPTFRPRRASSRDETVDAVRDGRDGPGPHASRVLEVHGSRASKARAGKPVRDRDSRLPPPRRRPHPPEAARARRRRDRRLRPLRPRRETSTAASASTSGCGAAAGTLAEPNGVSSLSATSSVDWSRTTAWGRAATTRACS